LLIRHKVNIHATTNSWLTDSVYGMSSGQTALHWAAEHGHLQVVLCLLKYGSLPIAEDERGSTPADVAKEHPQVKQIVREEESKKYVCVRFLIPSSGFAAEYSVLANLWKAKQNNN